MKKVLVAIPYKKILNPVLYSGMIRLSDRLKDGNPDYKIDLARMKNDIHLDGNDPFAPHSLARNKLINKYLDGHDLVMWIDADLVDYPADIITQLDRTNPGGVTAPLVLIEGTRQFYDTYGYRENGRSVMAFSPYFASTEKLVELDAVGCAYLIPARIYTCNRYQTTTGQTEHFSIMQKAKEAGMKIICDTGVTVYHANLPDYGEEWHGH